LFAFVPDFGNLFWLAIPLYAILTFTGLFYTYPLVLEARIREGKAWVYVPKWWKSTPKLLAKPYVLSMYILCSISFAGMVNHFIKKGLGFYILIPVGFILAVIVNKNVMRLRFSQQREAYFKVYDLIVQEYDKQGKSFNEVEIRNLAMYEHQNGLRVADNEGRLIHFLKEKIAQPM
jgi:hypothetical protein